MKVFGSIWLIHNFTLRCPHSPHSVLLACCNFRYFCVNNHVGERTEHRRLSIAVGMQNDDSRQVVRDRLVPLSSAFLVLLKTARA